MGQKIERLKRKMMRSLLHRFFELIEFPELKTCDCKVGN